MRSEEKIRERIKLLEKSAKGLKDERDVILTEGMIGILHWVLNKEKEGE